jgi:mRNA interferase YafQ
MESLIYGITWKNHLKMRKPYLTKRFRKDLAKIIKSNRYKKDDLLKIVDTIANELPLERKHLDHDLTGNFAGHRECHIKPDWLLIYRLEPDRLVLVRTGSHSELF